MMTLRKIFPKNRKEEEKIKKVNFRRDREN